MAQKSKHQRAIGALALIKARYIIETEEWNVQTDRRQRVERDDSRQRLQRGEDRPAGDGGKDGGDAGRQGQGGAGW